jgi:hypothetical protein
MNPFGAGVPRFDYQRQPIQKPEVQNGMISVKDKEVWEKREALHQSISMHRKLSEMKPMAVFSSNVKREGSQQRVESNAVTEKTAPTNMLNSMYALNSTSKRSSAF